MKKGEELKSLWISEVWMGGIKAIKSLGNACNNTTNTSFSPLMKSY